MATEVMVATGWDTMASVQLMPMPTMAAGDMEATDMARDPLMPRPTTDGAPTDMESVQLMPMPTMAAGDMEATDMARDPLMPMPIMDGAPTDMESVQLMLMLTTAGEDMAAMDMAKDLLMPTTAGVAMEAMDTESKFLFGSTPISNCLDLIL